MGLGINLACNLNELVFDDTDMIILLS